MNSHGNHGRLAFKRCVSIIVITIVDHILTLWKFPVSILKWQLVSQLCWDNKKIIKVIRKADWGKKLSESAEKMGAGHIQIRWKPPWRSPLSAGQLNMFITALAGCLGLFSLYLHRACFTWYGVSHIMCYLGLINLLGSLTQIQRVVLS